jgi:tRNA (cmo5U34)-methyltransferase
METTHEGHHHASEHHDHTSGHEASGEQRQHGGDWSDEEFVRNWLTRQEERAPERRRRFTVMRALIPKRRDDEFRYLNIGAGPGILDEVLLDHFTGSQATLVDLSLVLLNEARNRLEKFGERVEYAQGNLASPDWVGAIGGPFDFVVSTMTVHHVGQPERIRALYAEVYRLLGHGGMFLNMEFVRPARPSLAPLAAWAAQDPEAGLSGRSVHGNELPGTMIEHLGWLSEAGFSTVDVFWKDMDIAVLCGIRDHLHMPEGHADTEAAGHSHSH